jgi:hypothetical protein
MLLAFVEYLLEDGRATIVTIQSVAIILMGVDTDAPDALASIVTIGPMVVAAIVEHRTRLDSVGAVMRSARV